MLSNSDRSRVSLCDLPTELLVRILWYTQYQPLFKLSVKMQWKDFNNALATCRRLRNVALAAPELWMYLDCNWNKAWRQLCLTRSQDHPLVIYFYEDDSVCQLDDDGPVKSVVETETLYAIFHKAYRLTWMLTLDRVTSGAAHAVLGRQMPYLQDLRVESPLASLLHLDSFVLCGWTTQLTRLDLIMTSIGITNQLLFPALRLLKLSKCETTLDGMLHLLRHAPLLKSVSLNNLAFVPGTETGTETSRFGALHTVTVKEEERPIELPALHWLNMTLKEYDSWNLLWFIPDPSHYLTIRVDSAAAATPERADRLLKRIQDFWSLHRPEAPMPPMTISLRRSNAPLFLEMGQRNMIFNLVRHPVTLVEAPPARLEAVGSYRGVHPFLSASTCLGLDARGYRIGTPFYQDILDGLENLEDVCIRRAYEDMEDHEEQLLLDEFNEDLSSFEAWIRSYAVRGRPLKNLTFKFCHPTLEAFATKIRGAGVVDEVTWFGDEN
jgi:hypothetical protein